MVVTRIGAATLLLVLGCAATALAQDQTWTNLGPDGGTVLALAIDPGVTSTIYAGTAAGVFKTTNGGMNWSRSSNGLTNLDVRAIVIDPITTANVYAGTARGVFKSIDGGTSWSPASTNLGNGRERVSGLVIDPFTPTILYAVTDGSGIFKTTDGGHSWQSLEFGGTSLVIESDDAEHVVCR